MKTLTERLQAQLIHYDDEAYVTLANRGLLRRAQKDLDTVSTRIEDQGERVLVHVDRFIVELDARGPATARCSCPADGVCRHILCACMTLAAAGEKTPALPDESPEPVHTRDALHEDLLRVTTEELERWTGRPDLRWAMHFAADVDIESVAIGGDNHVAISFARPRVTFLYVGGGFQAVVTDYRGRDRDRRVAAAILTYQRAYGMFPPRLPAPETEAGGMGREDSEGHSPHRRLPAQMQQLRRMVLQSAIALICECVGIGLSHLSDTVHQRITTLAISAQGADLHRLALMLRRLADQVEMLVQRKGTANEEDLFNDLALAYALAYAIQAALDDNSGDRAIAIPAYLAGESRTAYQEIGKLELAGLGAYPWRTASGYLGLTLIFWCADEKQWYSYTQARPEIQDGFDPLACYHSPGPWSGVKTPEQLTGRRITLLNARANRSGRLSSSEKTTAIVHSEWPPEEILSQSLTDWSPLTQRARGFSLLAERNFHDDLTVLQPARIGKPRFDPGSQRLFWPLLDEQGLCLDAMLDFSPYTEHAIQRIEALEDTGMMNIQGVLVRMRHYPGALYAEPISIIYRSANRPVDVLSFDAGMDGSILHEPDAQPGCAFRKLPKKPEGPSASPESRGSFPIYRFLAPLDHECLRAAERGLGMEYSESGQLPAPILTQIARCEQAGMVNFGAVTSTAIDDRVPPAETLLRIRYLSLQYRRVAGFEEWHQ